MHFNHKSPLRTFSSRVCSMTTHCPVDVSHTSVRLLMPLAHLYTSSGGGSVSAGFTQLGNRWRLSASYHRYLRGLKVRAD